MKNYAYLCNRNQLGIVLTITLKSGGNTKKSAKPMKTISEIINSVKGSQFAHIIYMSEVTEIGKKLQAIVGGKVTKIVDTEVQVNYSYENAVNNRLEKQGNERTFQTGHLSWGTWKEFNKVIEHKGELYLRCYEFSGARENVAYFVDGKLANAEQAIVIEKILASKAEVKSEKQANYGLVEHQVKPKAIKFSNILLLKVNNEEYSLQEQTTSAK